MIQQWFSHFIFQFQSFSTDIALRMKADIIRLNKGHFTPLIMYYAKDKKKWERGKKRWLQRRLVSGILILATQKTQSDLVVWISIRKIADERLLILNFLPGAMSVSSCCHSQHVLCGLFFLYIYIYFIIAWLNPSLSHRRRQHELIYLSDICSMTPVTWRRLM